MIEVGDRIVRPLVSVVEDDAETNRAVRGLAGSHGWDSAGFANGLSFLDAYEGTRPGCIVLDLRLPDVSGLHVASRLGERQGHVAPIIFITGHGDLQTAVQAMKQARVHDFIEKPFRPGDLLRVMRDSIAWDTEVFEGWRERARTRDRLRRLSERERQVLDALMLGKSNKQIAVDLEISHKTISTHRTHVLAKFECQSIVDVVRMIDGARLELPVG